MCKAIKNRSEYVNMSKYISIQTRSKRSSNSDNRYQQVLILRDRHSELPNGILLSSQ
jgi:hypothetical protein